MAVSQNGYRACDRSVLHSPRVPGTNIDFPGGIRKGAAGDILLWVAEQLHTRVENGGTGYGMWGFACRSIRGYAEDELAATGEPDPELDLVNDLDDGTPIPNAACSIRGFDDLDLEDPLYVADAMSNHASGTAIDWHAPRHPLGKRNTYSAADQREIHRIEAETEGCVRWGGDWGRPDDMHWEVVKSEADCARVLRKLRGPGYRPPRPVLEYGDEGAAVREVQQILGITVDGIYGRGTETAVKNFQREHGLTVDGIVGPRTWAALDNASDGDGGDTRTYTIKSGDTLGEIAERFNTTVDAILRANPGITDADQIQVGQVITIPGAESAPPAEPGVRGEIKHVYETVPELKERLGDPVTPEMTCPDGKGKYNHFERWGSIYWYPRLGAHAVGGAIRGKWKSLDWERGPLGYPISHEANFDDYDRDGNLVHYRLSLFQHGYIIWNSATKETVAYH